MGVRSQVRRIPSAGEVGRRLGGISTACEDAPGGWVKSPGPMPIGIRPSPARMTQGA